MDSHLSQNDSLDSSKVLPLARFPIVLLQYIFQFLSVSSLLVLSRTSHLFQSIGTTELAWKSEALAAENESITNAFRDRYFTSTPSFRRCFSRIVQLNSLHTQHLMHTSLIRSHANIEWDIHHDTPTVQENNYIAHGTQWTDDKLVQFNSNNELLVLSRHLAHLTSLTIKDNSFTPQQLEELFQILSKGELITLVFGSYHILVSDPRLSTTAFARILTITSLTQLSINSIYYTKGQISALSQLPILTSLSLVQHPHGQYLRLFDESDLLTLGTYPLLQELLIDHFQITVDYFVQFLQQPNLCVKLQSFSLLQLRFHNYGSKLSLSHIRQAFDGYINLTKLQLYEIQCKKFHRGLLRALSSLDESESSPLNFNPIDNIRWSIMDEVGHPFLPNLVQLWHHNSRYGSYFLPPLTDLNEFFQHNSRTQLCLILNCFNPGMEDVMKEYHPLAAQHSQFSIRRIYSAPNSHIARHPNPLNNGAENYINLLLYVGWLKNRGEAIR